jgi:hypothetical protein
MKRFIPILLLAVLSISSAAQVSLNYYLPKDINYDQSIITPEDFAGHQVGEWHLTHDKLYYYMLKLSDISGRAFWEEYGKSHEGRPLGNLVISSEENIQNIESIRKKHRALSDPARSSGIDISEMPVVVKLGYGVHGNESSSQNAAMLMAYYLLAGNGDKIDELLQNTVILLDPSLNPDGFNRHASWVNMYRSMNLNPDANSIEFSEAWPGGRTNHYWYDLNRDYIMLQHPESIGRVAAFHRWKPNINTDHHEMGASSTFFFQPGVRTRENPLTPKENYELVTEIAEYHIKYLDEIGSLYYSEEGFDDFYLGKGSAYPDIHASVGILFEQAGVKGHLREVSSGLISFPFAIKNQVTVSLSSLEAGLRMREKLLQHQVDFYNDALSKAGGDPIKGYVFSDDGDEARAAHFMENLLRHQINIYRLFEDVSLNGKNFSAGNSYIVPLDQPEYRYIKSMFETVSEYQEDVFYDISTWNLPMSFNLPYSSYGSSKSLANIRGPRVILPQFPEGSLQASKDAYAYVFEWNAYYAPKALYMLQDAGVVTRLAKGKFVYDDGEFKKSFKEGSIMVQAYGQKYDRDALYDLMKDVVTECGVKVYGLATGHTPSGIDLGSNSFGVINKPELLMYIGNGSSSRDAGEIWHILDTRFNMPVTMVNGDRSVDLNRYSVVVLTGSGLSESVSNDLVEWTRAGGTLIALKGANSFVARTKLADVVSIPAARVENNGTASYASRSANSAHHRIPGSIFEVQLDLTHPLCYGYTRDLLPVFKSSASAYQLKEDIYSNPAVFSKDAYLSGFTSEENTNRISGSAYISVHSAGRGTVVSFYDNTNFRGIWYGTTKLFMNSIFFGQSMRGGRR